MSVLRSVDNEPVDNEPVDVRSHRFREALCDSLVPYDVRVETGPDFRGRIRSGDFGAIRVNEFTEPPLEGIRTPKLIRRSDPELCKIDVLMKGRFVVEQSGREASLRPGDFTFVDLSRPSHVGASESQLALVVFPRSLLPLSSEEMARLTAVPMPGQNGMGSLISSLALQIVRHMDDLPPADGVRLSTLVLDLLVTHLAGRLDRPFAVAPDTHRRALTYRIHIFIEERLGDPDLSPTVIAAAHHISLRYLYKLFEAEGRTVAGWIRERRLERCRQDLLNPAQHNHTIGAIAAKWGFISPEHFSRLFRAAYQIPPGEFRHLHLRSM
jgi:AraC-like DNA-binding protein